MKIIFDNSDWNGTGSEPANCVEKKHRSNQIENKTTFPNSKQNTTFITNKNELKYKHTSDVGYLLLYITCSVII